MQLLGVKRDDTWYNLNIGGSLTVETQSILRLDIIQTSIIIQLLLHFYNVLSKFYKKVNRKQK